MNKLIALVFDDPYKADEARAALNRMGGEGLIEIEETALIVREQDGKLRVSQEKDTVAKKQHVGHVIGLIAAALTGTTPLIMAATLGGRLVGRITDNGVTNQFIKTVQKDVAAGKSALLLYAQSDAERRQKVLERLQPFGAEVLQTDLPPELEQELVDGLQSQKAA